MNSINDKWREEEYKGTFSKMWECHRQLTIKVFFFRNVVGWIVFIEPSGISSLRNLIKRLV